MNSVVERLLKRHAELLGYLRKQGVTGDQAEDAQQSALECGLEPWRSLPAPEAAASWFYGVLRISVADRARRLSAAGRVLDRARGDPLRSSERICGSKVMLQRLPRRSCVVLQVPSVAA